MENITQLFVPAISTPASLEELDEQGYLFLNRDVLRAGCDPKFHLVSYGLKEGRRQLNYDDICQVRKRKLEKIRFLGGLESTTAEDGTIDFITREQKELFGISDIEIPISDHKYPEDLSNLIAGFRDGIVLDLGAGLREKYYSNVVNADIFQSGTTDVICLGECLPFEDNQFDCIISIAVLEHTKKPWVVAKEIERVLKPGGRLILDYPFLQPFHGYPHHYFNATPQGNRSLFEEGFNIESVSIPRNFHPIYALKWMVCAWTNGLPKDEALKFLNMNIRDLTRPEEIQLNEDYAKMLPEAFNMMLAAGSRVVATKKWVFVKECG